MAPPLYKSLRNKTPTPSNGESENGLKPESIKGFEMPTNRFFLYLKNKRLVAFQGESIYDVGTYFWRAMFKENLSSRASSLSFNFFLALFPAIIFLLTLIAYLPFYGLKTQFIQELGKVLPKQSFQEIHGTILEILNKQNTGLLSFGFITTLYFVSNAFHLLIISFDRRLPQGKNNNWLQIRGKAIFLTFWLTILIIIALLILTWAFQSVLYINTHHWPLAGVYEFCILFLEYIILAALMFVIISSIYFFGPSNSKRWRFFTPGGTMASVLAGLSTIAFGFYVNNFNAYNKVYGSIGAIIALMVLIYINMLTTIIGFELNVSIDKARLKKTKISTAL